MKYNFVYNNYMKFFLTFSIILLSISKPATAGQTLIEIMTPPVDSADRENLRIWVPIERGSRCRLKIDILDDSNQVVRHLVNLLAGPGYHNFFWDKKDDSGFFVDSGTYTYLVDDCGKKKSGEFEARFQGVRVEIISEFGIFSTEVKRSSIDLTVYRLAFIKGKPLHVLDTTLDEGIHRIVLPMTNISHGDYIQTIQIDGRPVDNRTSKK